jgi:hypothetical protein
VARCQAALHPEGPAAWPAELRQCTQPSASATTEMASAAHGSRSLVARTGARALTRALTGGNVAAAGLAAEGLAQGGLRGQGGDREDLVAGLERVVAAAREHLVAADDRDHD